MGTPNYPDEPAAQAARAGILARAAYAAATTRKAFDQIKANALSLFGDLLVKAGGRLQVFDEANNLILFVGTDDLGVETGLGILRPGGTQAFRATGTPTADLFWSLHDLEGNIVASDDAVSGRGLATPWVQNYALLNGVTDVTSSSFVTVSQAVGFRQHPEMRVVARVVTPSGTDAEVRLIKGANEMVVQPFPAGLNVYGHVQGPLPNDEGQQGFEVIDIQARRVSGTGTVEVEPLGAWGTQSI